MVWPSLSVQEGKIIFANHQVEQITGYTTAELQAMDPFALISVEDRDKIRGYSAMRSRGEPVPDSYELTITRKNGALCWLSRRVVLVNWQGKPATLVLDTDISEQVQSEQERQQLRDKAEMSSRLAAGGRNGLRHCARNKQPSNQCSRVL